MLTKYGKVESPRFCFSFFMCVRIIVVMKIFNHYCPLKKEPSFRKAE